ncbi:enoyl-CoA hydratase/isomerase family protein [Propionimicrobium sp. PCR01-08-3]|uniref:enoyl-CoA hydratase/isomerase family protein n=1 Tax=Propionimicrobium sp. PCR01-08-3 TaxID=3052086 RepID=UPI00255C330F|nr:enoyl-CoA hydratase/isomerase family protein [Propionimicrobium sp. PCR01-08-3]WIY83675.1 enoyl-CoA hydratase/isomerase family protein [Propionimicrobium sp. PCR01-08-3]
MTEKQPEDVRPDGEITLSVDGTLATIHISRPNKLNSFTIPMVEQLESHLATIDDSEDIRVVLVTTAGERAFSAGADIKAFSQLSATRMWSQWIRRGHALFDKLAGLRQPSIAAIDGNAFGGGLELALACDIRVMANDAKVGLSELGIGTLPGWGGTARLQKTVGVARAKRMIFTSKMIDAATALDWGLVTDVADRSEVVAKATEIAHQVASRAPIALQMTKQIIDGQSGEGVRLTLEALGSAASSATDDFMEGVTAFRNKRTPEFTGSFDDPASR